MPAPRGTAAAAELGADPHDLLDFGLRAGPGAAAARPPGAHSASSWDMAGSNVGIGDDPVAGQGPAQRLNQPACARLACCAHALR